MTNATDPEILKWDPSAGLAGRTIIVTGAASGIGAAMVRAAATAGLCVIATDINAAALDENVNVARQLGAGRVEPLAMDLSDIGSQARLVDFAQSTGGQLDFLFHAAAVLRRQYDINDITEKDFDFQVGVNQKATWFLNRAVCEALKKQGHGGAIVNIVSAGAFTGGLGGSWVYASTKGALISMIRGFARTYAGHNIRVNGLSPGTVDTPMLTKDLKEGQLDAILNQLVPLKRIANPLDIAYVGLFLLSHYASYVDGVTLDVDGAWLCR